MTKRDTVSKAEALLAAATEQVIQDGGIIHEDALFDAAEMALDGCDTKSIAERIKQARAEAYQPTSGWRRGGR